MRMLRHVLEAGACVTVALLTAAAASAADAQDLRGRWKRNPASSQDAVSKVVASLSLEGRGFTPDEQRFHDALLHFAKVIDSLQIEQTAEDARSFLVATRSRSTTRGGRTSARACSAAGWKSSPTGGRTS